MAGIVLAGGKSARMGRDKALLPWNGRTLLEHVIEQVRGVADPVIVVAESADRYSVPNGVQIVGDRFPGEGPLGGLITGLEVVPSQWHFVVACDHPLIQRELIDLLYGRSDSGCDAIIPQVGGKLQSLCALYNGLAGSKLMKAYRAGMRSMHEAIQSLNIQIVGDSWLRAADPRLLSFRNINSPEDYERLLGMEDACE